MDEEKRNLNSRRLSSNMNSSLGSYAALRVNHAKSLHDLTELQQLQESVTLRIKEACSMVTNHENDLRQYCERLRLTRENYSDLEPDYYSHSHSVRSQCAERNRKRNLTRGRSLTSASSGDESLYEISAISDGQFRVHRPSLTKSSCSSVPPDSSPRERELTRNLSQVSVPIYDDSFDSGISGVKFSEGTSSDGVSEYSTSSTPRSNVESHCSSEFSRSDYYVEEKSDKDSGISSYRPYKSSTLDTRFSHSRAKKFSNEGIQRLTGGPFDSDSDVYEYSRGHSLPRPLRGPHGGRISRCRSTESGRGTMSDCSYSDSDRSSGTGRAQLNSLSDSERMSVSYRNGIGKSFDTFSSSNPKRLSQIRSLESGLPEKDDLWQRTTSVPDSNDNLTVQHNGNVLNGGISTSSHQSQAQTPKTVRFETSCTESSKSRSLPSLHSMKQDMETEENDVDLKPKKKESKLKKFFKRKSGVYVVKDDILSSGKQKDKEKKKSNKDKNKSKNLQRPTSKENFFAKVLQIVDGEEKITHIEVHRISYGSFGFFVQEGYLKMRDGFFVGKLDSDSQKLFAGALNEGDELLEINGQNAQSMTLKNIFKVMSEANVLYLKTIPFTTRKSW